MTIPGARESLNEDRTMNSSDDDLRQQIALFRYDVIADLVHLPVGAPGAGAMMRAKAEKTYTIPGTTRTRVAAETMRRWIKDYRYGGFDALYPKPRTDRGKPRRLPPEVAERLIALKTENDALSVRAIIQKAHEEGIDHPLASSTVHRLFSREGLFDKKPPDGADRRRFAFRHAGEMWNERRHARTQGPARPQPAQDLPDRLHRRRHPRHPVRRPSPWRRTLRRSCRCSRTR